MKLGEPLTMARVEELQLSILKTRDQPMTEQEQAIVARYRVVSVWAMEHYRAAMKVQEEFLALPEDGRHDPDKAAALNAVFTEHMDAANAIESLDLSLPIAGFDADEIPDSL